MECCWNEDNNEWYECERIGVDKVMCSNCGHKYEG